MNEKLIEERKAKLLLEAAIMELLANFTRETGLKVETIYINKVEDQSGKVLFYATEVEAKL